MRCPVYDRRLTDMTSESDLSVLKPLAVNVARGTSHIFLLGIAANLISAAIFIVIARVVTTSQMGIIGIFMFLNGLCRLLVALGMPGAVTKFVAENYAKKELDVASGILHQAVRVTIVTSIATALAIFLMARQMSLIILGDESHTVLFQIYSVDLVAGGLLSVLNAALLGLGKTKDLSQINVGYLCTRGVLTALFVLATEPLRGLLAAWTTSDLIAMAILFLYNRKYLPSRTRLLSLGELVRFSTPLYVQDIVNFAYGWFDRAMLFAYTSLSTAGIYLTATTALGIIAGFPGAISTVLLPTYSGLHGSHGRKVLHDSVRSASRYTCYLATPLAFGLFATARAALTLFAGESYQEGTLSLMILCLFFGLTLISTNLGNIPLAIGNTVLSLKIVTANAFVGLVFASILIPYFQAHGAALAKGVAMLLGLYATIVFLRRELDIAIDQEALTKSLLAGVSMALVVLVVQVLFYNRFLLPIYVLIGGVTYLLALRWLHAIRNSDVELLKTFLGSRFEFATRPVERFLVRQTRQ